MNPKFKVGDIVQRHSHGKYCIIKIDKINLISNVYYITFIDDQIFCNPNNSESYLYMSLVDTHYQLVNNDNNKEPTWTKSMADLVPKDCTCNSWQLLHKGCNCGYAVNKNSKYGIEHHH